MYKYNKKHKAEVTIGLLFIIPVAFLLGAYIGLKVFEWGFVMGSR